MSRTLFFCNLESPGVDDIVKLLNLQGKTLVMSANSIDILGREKFKDELQNKRIMSWSWKDEEADFYIQNAIVDIFPYLYPDTINPDVFKKLLNVSPRITRSYGSFRLGFGVQEELFDIFIASIVGASEIAYFELLSSLQLLNPVNQLEYRKSSYEFLKFIGKETIYSFGKKIQIKKYKIIRQIPFYESFSEKVRQPDAILYYTIEE